MVHYKIYIIIVSYNGERFIKKCLSSIRENSVVCQTIVIDNNSIDKTTQIIKHDFPDVRLIEEKKNLGFGKANNIGLKIALKENADYVFLLNQDAYIMEDTIEKLLFLHKEYPKYNILSPVHLNGTIKELDYNFSKYVSASIFPNTPSVLLTGEANLVYTCDFINAAVWLIPLKTLKIVGLFDPLFIHYGEDDDYIKRLKYHGGKIGLVTNSFIVHDRPQNNPDNKYNYVRRLTINFLKLKNMNTSFCYSVCAFIFHSSVKFFSLLISIKTKEIVFSTKLFWKTIYLLPKIKASRKESIQGKSFIDIL